MKEMKRKLFFKWIAKKKKNINLQNFQLYFNVSEAILLIKIYKCTNEKKGYTTDDRTSHLKISITNL